MKTKLNRSGKAFWTTLILALVLGSGCDQKEEFAARITIPDFYGPGLTGNFQSATVLEKKVGYIKFKSGDKVIEHSGRYTIQN